MATGDMDHSMSLSGVPGCGNGGEHEHGCLDALTISLCPRRVGFRRPAG